MNQLEGVLPASDRVHIGLAHESDLPELARIAEENFASSKNYEGLERAVTSRYAERNSVENLRLKLESGRHRILVARERATERVVGFAIYKALNETCALATRIHTARDFEGGRLAPMIHRHLVEMLRGDGYELLYGEVSGESLKLFLRGGFLYVDSFKNKAVANARIDRVVMDVHAGVGTARAESAYLPLLSAPEAYSLFLDGYGLLAERLFKKIERMHEAGTSGITQSVFEHVRNGLPLVRELREQIGNAFTHPVAWDDVELMWIFHDLGEIGMDNDIPSYKKSKAHRLDEDKKATRILESVQPAALRAKLVALHGRHSHKGGPVDREAALCVLVDKLEAAVFIGTSGIGQVWKARAGALIFQWLLKRNALGAFVEPLRQLSPFLDASGRSYLQQRLAGILAMYYDGGLISKSFLDERTATVAAALSGR
jgi:hypothetical protein